MRPTKVSINQISSNYFCFSPLSEESEDRLMGMIQMIQDIYKTLLSCHYGPDIQTFNAQTISRKHKKITNRNDKMIVWTLEKCFVSSNCVRCFDRWKQRFFDLLKNLNQKLICYYDMISVHICIYAQQH